MQTPLGPSPSYLSGDQRPVRGSAAGSRSCVYIYDEAWSFGASIKSPQWFDTYRFNAVNPGNGQPRHRDGQHQLPSHRLRAASYKGIDKLLWATDFRILDYRDTNGFRSGGFNNQTGA